MLRTAATATCLTFAACAASALTVVDISLTDVENYGAFAGPVTDGVLTIEFDETDPALELVPGVPTSGTLLDVTLSMGGAVFSALGDQSFLGFFDGTDTVQSVYGQLTPTTTGQALGGDLLYELSLVFNEDVLNVTESYFAAQDAQDAGITVLAKIGDITQVDGQVPLPAAGWMMALGFGTLALRGRKT